MATKKATTSRAALMREHYTENPTATVSEVAKKFKTTYSIAYMCKRGMEENAVKDVAALKTRKAPKKKATPLPTPETKDGYLYTWVNTNALSEDTKDALAERLNPEAITMIEPQPDPVNHPWHYKVGGIETIDFIEAKGLTYHLGNAVKYISRADHKGNRKQDLEKAKWYLERAIAQA
jgi:transposase